MDLEGPMGCYGPSIFEGDFDKLDSVACSTLPRNRPNRGFDQDEPIKIEASNYSDNPPYLKLHIRNNNSLKLNASQQAPTPNLSGSHKSLELSNKVSTPKRNRFSLGSLPSKNSSGEIFIKTSKPAQKKTDKRQPQYVVERKQALTVKDIDKIHGELKNLQKKYKKLILRLSHCRLNDLTALKIAGILQSNINITRLELSFNDIGFKGAEAIIGAAQANIYLRHVDLQWNDKIQQDTMENLRIMNYNPKINLFIDNTPPYLKDDAPGSLSLQ